MTRLLLLLLLLGHALSVDVEQEQPRLSGGLKTRPEDSSLSSDDEGTSENVNDEESEEEDAKEVPWDVAEWLPEPKSVEEVSCKSLLPGQFLCSPPEIDPETQQPRGCNRDSNK